MPQPLSVRPGTTEWIAATLAPPEWHPVRTQVGATDSVWLVVIDACCALMFPEAVTWQPPCAQAKLPLGTVLAGLAWHFTQPLAPPWSDWSSSGAWHSVHACVP